MYFIYVYYIPQWIHAFACDVIIDLCVVKIAREVNYLRSPAINAGFYAIKKYIITREHNITLCTAIFQINSHRAFIITRIAVIHNTKPNNDKNECAYIILYDVFNTKVYNLCPPPFPNTIQKWLRVRYARGDIMSGLVLDETSVCIWAPKQSKYIYSYIPAVPKVFRYTRIIITI